MAKNLHLQQASHDVIISTYMDHTPKMQMVRAKQGTYVLKKKNQNLPHLRQQESFRNQCAIYTEFRNLLDKQRRTCVSVFLFTYRTRYMYRMSSVLHVCWFSLYALSQSTFCQCVQVCCSVYLGEDTLQHTATHCNTLQHTATHCNTLHSRRLGLIAIFKVEGKEVELDV